MRSSVSALISRWVSEMSLSAGRQVCPLREAASCKTCVIAAITLKSLSRSTPSFSAILSAVRKPIPSTSSTSLYGFSVTMSLVWSP